MSKTVPLTDYPERSDAERLIAATKIRDLMRTRRSVRDFTNTAVSKDLIERCIETAGTAPSGANHQPWYFVAISDPHTKQKIRRAAEAEEREFYERRASEEWLEALAPLGTDAQKPFLETAPWLIVVFAQRRGGVHVKDNKKNYYVTESVGLATGLLLTALHSAGLATLTHTPAPMGFLTELCGRPADEKPFILIVVGHPAPDAHVPVHALTKKSLEEISNFIEPYDP